MTLTSHLESQDYILFPISKPAHVYSETDIEPQTQIS